MRAGSGSRNREGGSLLFIIIIYYWVLFSQKHSSINLISTKGQKMKNVMFWHSLKIKPGFLILLINLKTGATQ